MQAHFLTIHSKSQDGDGVHLTLTFILHFELSGGYKLISRSKELCDRGGNQHPLRRYLCQSHKLWPILDSQVSLSNILNLKLRQVMTIFWEKDKCWKISHLRLDLRPSNSIFLTS
jgi:hypothetical protein